MRREQALQRKIYRAFSYFYEKPIVEVKYHARKDTFEVTVFFIYEEKRHRMDYEYFPGDPLPKIRELRNQIWSDLLSLPIYCT